jgi:hypothetical protein
MQSAQMGFPEQSLVRPEHIASYRRFGEIRLERPEAQPGHARKGQGRWRPSGLVVAKVLVAKSLHYLHHSPIPYHCDIG